MYLSNAAWVFEVLKLRSACQLHRCTVRWFEPNGMPVKSDRDLLAGQVFQAREPFFMEVASSFPNKNLVTHPEAKGASRINERRATVSAWNVTCGLHQRCCRRVLRRSSRRRNGHAEQHDCGQCDGKDKPGRTSGLGHPNQTTTFPQSNTTEASQCTLTGNNRNT